MRGIAKYMYPEILQFAANLVPTSWDDADNRVKAFFASHEMPPGWQKMASYSDGVTLTHVIECRQREETLAVFEKLGEIILTH